jgi:hypothetical protein
MTQRDLGIAPMSLFIQLMLYLYKSIAVVWDFG